MKYLSSHPPAEATASSSAVRSHFSSWKDESEPGYKSTDLRSLRVEKRKHDNVDDISSVDTTTSKSESVTSTQPVCTTVTSTQPVCTTEKSTQPVCPPHEPSTPPYVASRKILVVTSLSNSTVFSLSLASSVPQSNIRSNREAGAY